MKQLNNLRYYEFCILMNFVSYVQVILRYPCSQSFSNPQVNLFYQRAVCLEIQLRRRAESFRRDALSHSHFKLYGNVSIASDFSQQLRGSATSRRSVEMCVKIPFHLSQFPCLMVCTYYYVEFQKIVLQYIFTFFNCRLQLFYNLLVFFLKLCKLTASNQLRRNILQLVLAIVVNRLRIYMLDLNRSQIILNIWN